MTFKTARDSITHLTEEYNMPNLLFKKMVLNGLEFEYPKVNQPYRFNSQEKRSEPCAATAVGASYSIGFRMNNEDGKELFEKMKSHYDECKKLDPKLPEFKTVFGMKKNDDSTISFKAKRNSTTRAGDVNPAPMVVDGQRQPLEDKAFWNGSKGNLVVVIFPTNSPAGEGGISVMLDKVQVLEAVYSDGGDDFQLYDVPKPKAPTPAPAKKDDPFGLPAVDKLSSEEFDDIIPF